jgi:acyl-CoA dehydrogenase
MSSPADQNELRTILGDAVTRLLTDLVTPDLITSAERGDWPAALWRAVEENGLTMPLVPEARGGAGASWADAFVVVNAAGRHAPPIPFAETIVASWLVADAGLGVPEGPLTLASGTDAPLALARTGDRWRVTGVARRVPWGALAEHVVVLGDAGGRATVALVARGEATVEPGKNVALEPRDTLTFDGATAVAAAPTRQSPDAVRVYGALIRSAQMAGALEGALALSVKYVTERKQFGRPIGSFQAIQHNLAILAAQTAAAGLAAQHAFAAADRGDARFEIACAKARVGEAAGIGASIAHQAHGAIGFTYEHSLHFLTRRLWSWRAEYGAEAVWQAELGRETARRGAEALWPYLTAR